MANLQDQLGLGLAVKQTQQQNNNQNYSFESTNPLTGGTEFSAGIAIPQQNEIDLGGGAAYYNAGGGGGGTPAPTGVQKVSSPTAQSFSASSGVTAPQGTTNVGIGDTFSGITPKRDKNIAQSAGQVGTIPPVSGVPTVPVSPTLDINQQQRLANIAKRQGVAGIQQPITPEKPEISPTGLQGAELQAYNQLTPQEQKTFQALATQGIKAQTDYLQQTKAAQEYAKGQESISQQIEANRAAAEDIQARQQLESAAKQVANLKQNIGYLGSQGQPGVSASKLDAVSNQVALAQKTYDDVVKIDQLNKANRALGQESHALQFTRSMTQLQDDLDSKVNKGIQSALNQFNAAELKGKLDTIPEIEAFQQQLYAQLDGDLSSIMDTNIEARKFLIERYDKLAESQKTQMQAQEKAKQEMAKRANTVNKEMSNALGYFVNENGDPLIDQKTGGNIVVPPEATTNYDASTGQMIIMTKNRDGSVGVQMKQVGTPKATYQKVGTDPNTGEDIYGFVNPQSQTVTPYTGGGSIDKNTAIQKYGSTPAVRNFNPGNIMDTGFGGQKVPGERFTVFNSPQEGFSALVSKIQNIQNGGSKVYSPNDTLLQYISKYAPSSDNNNPQAYAQGIANNLGISINTKIGQIDPTKLALEHARHEDGNSYRMLQDLGITGKQQAQATGSLATLATFMKDNQDRGQGYSNDDVKAFNEKIDRMAKAGDDKGMAIAYRNMVMKDKEFKKDFDDTQKFSTALDTVQKMVSDYEKAGKDTNALKKVAETVGRKLGLTTDTALAQLQTQMGVTMANYIKSISGTAASDAEVARLMGNMANIGNVEELNTAIISTVKDNAMNGLKSMIDTRMYGMPEELKPQVFGDIYKEEAKGLQVKQQINKIMPGIKGGMDFAQKIIDAINQK